MLFRSLGKCSTPAESNDYRMINRNLAQAVLRHLSKKFDFPAGKAFRGISKMCWPARFHILDDGCIVDGAHNPQGTLALAKLLRQEFPGAKFTIVFAAFADKDTEGLLRTLEPIAESFIFTRINARRQSAAPDQLEGILRRFSSKPAVKASAPAEALAIHSRSRCLVTGSLFLAGETLKIKGLEKQVLDIY